ncbi:MAG: hypothetical protein ACYCY1_12585 [Sulfuriferula sp.]
MNRIPDRCQVKMQALRKLFVTGRLLADRAQHSDDEILIQLGQAWFQEMEQIHAAAKPKETNHA